MVLHAQACSFTWPDGIEQHFNAPLPDELRAVLEWLGQRRVRRGDTTQGTV